MVKRCRLFDDHGQYTKDGLAVENTIRKLIYTEIYSRECNYDLADFELLLNKVVFDSFIDVRLNHRFSKGDK